MISVSRVSMRTTQTIVSYFRRAYVGNGHSYGRDVQHHSHGGDFGQRRRDAGRDQHDHADDNGRQAGGHVGAGFQENLLAVQQHHVDAAQLLPRHHGARYDHRLDVAPVREQLAETRFLFLRVVHGFLNVQRNCYYCMATQVKIKRIQIQWRVKYTYF